MARTYYLWQPGGPKAEYLVYITTGPEQVRRLLTVRPSATKISPKQAHILGWKTPRAAKYKGFWGIGGYALDYDAANPRTPEEAVEGAVRATKQLTDSAESVWQGQVDAMAAALEALEEMTEGTSAVPLDT